MFPLVWHVSFTVYRAAKSAVIPLGVVRILVVPQVPWLPSVHENVPIETASVPSGWTVGIAVYVQLALFGNVVTIVRGVEFQSTLIWA